MNGVCGQITTPESGHMADICVDLYIVLIDIGLTQLVLYKDRDKLQSNTSNVSS